MIYVKGWFPVGRVAYRGGQAEVRFEAMRVREPAAPSIAEDSTSAVYSPTPSMVWNSKALGSDAKKMAEKPGLFGVQGKLD